MKKPTLLEYISDKYLMKIIGKMNPYSEKDSKGNVLPLYILWIKDYDFKSDIVQPLQLYGGGNSYEQAMEDLNDKIINTILVGKFENGSTITIDTDYELQELNNKTNKNAIYSNFKSNNPQLLKTIDQYQESIAHFKSELEKCSIYDSQLINTHKKYIADAERVLKKLQELL